MAGLAYLVNKGNDNEGSDFDGKTIVLSSNLNLIDYYWIPIGSTSSHPFKGTFDGKGKTISGLVVSITDEGLETSTNGFLAAGLFGWNEGSIKNVNLSNSSILAIANAGSEGARAYAGGIAGANVGANSEISNCDSAVKITASSPSYSYAAGITGFNEATISLCTTSSDVSIKRSNQYYSHTELTDDHSTIYYGPVERAGGIVGLNVSGEILQCVNYGKISSSSIDPNASVNLNVLDDISISYYVGGIVSYNNGGIISDNINKGEIIASIDINNTRHGSYACTGGIAGWNNSEISNCYNSGVIFSKSDVNKDVYSLSYLYTGGIVGCTIGEESYIFSCCNEGNISAEYTLNLTNAGQYHYSYPCVAGIVGYAEGTIEDCCNLKNAKITASSSMSNYKEDKSRSYAGGIAAYNEVNSVNISNCYNEGTISSHSSSFSADSPSPGSTAYSGGIIGYLSTNGLIENCYSTIGSITAKSESHVSSYASNKPYPSVSYAGGISGRTLGKIINCFNESDIFSSNLIDTKTNVDAGFRTYPSANAGGITGALDDGDENNDLKTETILYCYNYGNVNASGNANSESRSGGITGFMSGGTISYSYNCGEISAVQNGDNAYVGGIVGICTIFTERNDIPKISQCYNMGRIQLTVNTSSNDSKSGLGGICGVNNGLITNSYNTASISCTSSAERLNVGGIVGYNRNSIDSCYNVGDLECPVTSNNCCLGSVVGKNDSVRVSNTFHINSTDGITGVGQSGASLGNDTVTGLNHDEMINLCLLSGNTNLNKNQSEMPWSPDIFGVNDGYPVLADVPIQIIPEDAQTNSEKAPKSVTFIGTNNEEVQQENYLDVTTLATGSKLNIYQQNSILDIFNIINPSYSWKKLIVDYDAIIDKAWNDVTTDTSKNNLLISTNGTYCGIITYDVSENSNSSTQYHYTTLSRTVELKDGLVYESNDNSDRTYSVIPDENEKVTAEYNVFQREGYAIVGWNDAADGLGKSYKLGDPIDLSLGSKILYAEWKEASPVNFNVSQSNSTIIIKDSTGNIFKTDANGKCMLPAGSYTYAVSKSGYITETGTITVEGPTENPNENIVIDIKLSYAEGGGIPISYNVTYNANGGSGTLIDTNSPYHSGVTVLVLENNFTNDGYTFKNWNTKADGSGTSYSAGERFSINSNVTLYAQWEEVSTPPVVQKVTVTFYIGDEVYKVIEVNKNSSLKDKFPVNPESSDNNSNFKEWNTEEDASGKAFTADSVVNEDTSVYAVWEKSSSSSSHSWWWIIIIIIILIIIIAAYYYYKKNQNQ